MDSRIKKDPDRMFECYVEYVRPQDNEEPQIKRLYPKNYQFDEDMKKNLSKFVFPTKESFVNAEEHFTFCLTDLQGTFRFGFCRYPPRGDICSCFISDLPWFKVFYKILDKLADFQLDHQTELLEPFLATLHKITPPVLGTDTVMSIVPEGITTGQVYTFPLPNPKRLPEIPTDHNLTLFYPTLHHQVILCLYANLLFERRIIITSKSLKTLSAAVHGCVLLLYPLCWQHIFIPITPHHLIDYCTAPMPFLMGIHSSMMEQVRHMPINDAVILDVDQSELESPYYEDLLNIPPDVSSQLKNAIKKSSSAYGDTATRAFLQANVALLGGYRLALKMREGESEITFDRDAFIKSRPHMEEFLSSLLEFQHFQQFLNSRIDRLASNKERDLFDEEVIIYEEEMKSAKWSSDQMKVAFKDMRDLLHKHSTKVAKNLVKDTKNLFQGKGNEKFSDIYSSFPGYSGSSRSSTLDPRPAMRSKAPPPVIPYEKHREGMERLSRTLQEQEKRLSIVEGNVPSLFITPATTGDNKVNLDDIAESTSIGSKDSLEVVTGQLIDISDDTIRVPTPVLIRPGLSDDAESTDSASIVSSSSSSSSSAMIGGSQWEVTQNEHAESPPPPPVPPPRKKKGAEGGRNLVSSVAKANSLPRTVESFEMGARSSPVADFGSSIADALINNSRRISDPLTANSMSNAGEELHRALQDTSFTAPLSDLTVSTAGSNSTTNISTMPVISEHIDSFNDPWQPFVSEESNPFKPGGARVAKPPPPIKPLPYSGSGLKYFEKAHSTNPGAVLTPQNVSSVGNDCKSSDPLADIFGNDGLKGYIAK